VGCAFRGDATYFHIWLYGWKIIVMIFDTETTGLVENMTTRAERQPEIIEFCGLRFDHNGDIFDELDILIKPQFPITDEITRMNGITNEMVIASPSFAEVAMRIRDFIEASDLVIAHNAAFDRDMVDLEFKKLGMTKIAWPHLICSIEQTIHLTGFRLNLSALHEYLFQEKFAGAHRARVDVEALARCIIELKKRGEM